jgi:hypothetical protein
MLHSTHFSRALLLWSLVFGLAMPLTMDDRSEKKQQCINSRIGQWGS